MTGGSSVERIDAWPGPIRAIPARKAVIAITVEKTVSARIHTHPRGAKSSVSVPVTAPPTPKEIAAPAQTRAASERGSSARPAVSAARM